MPPFVEAARRGMGFEAITHLLLLLSWGSLSGEKIIV